MKDPRFETFTSGSYRDATNAQQISLSFKHVASGMECGFKAFLDSYSENFNSQWNHEYVYGRMDPLSTFSGTSPKLLPSNLIYAHFLSVNQGT